MSEKKKTVTDWLKKFYPTDPSKCSRKVAALHSLRKFKGLRKKVLREYGLQMAGIGLFRRPNPKYEKQILNIDASSCALCHHYEDGNDGVQCAKCPLFIVRGGVTCYLRRHEEKLSPYIECVHNGNPEAMIKWLLVAREFEKNFV